MNEAKKDQTDVLAQLEKLTADYAVAKENIAALQTGKDDLEARLKDANEKIVKLATDNATLVCERDSLKADNARLTTEMADFNKKLAAEVAKHGIRGQTQTVTTQPNKKQTYTEQLLAKKGVNSLEELAAQRKQNNQQ